LAGQLDPATLSDVDTVINLAGAGVGDKRRNDAYRHGRPAATAAVIICCAGMPARLA
jgi:NAD dependent epimerase/dehydratase family enzyme